MTRDAENHKSSRNRSPERDREEKRVEREKEEGEIERSIWKQSINILNDVFTSI